MATKHTLIIVCGYLGQRVANLLLRRGGRVSALTRSARTGQVFKDLGIEPVVGDVLEPASLELPAADALVYAIGFDRTSKYSKRQTYVDGLRNVLSAVSNVDSLVYVSSTSVYGQSAGEWVDEASPAVPTTDGGAICLEAEQLLRSHAPDACIVRLAGIYGPNRLLRKVDALRKGDPISGNPEAYLNLIHVDDAARLVTHLSSTRHSQSVYLGCDGNPSTRRAFYQQLARLVRTDDPVFDPDLPSRYSAKGLNKRCRSSALGSLAFELAFHTAGEGLVQAVRETRIED